MLVCYLSGGSLWWDIWDDYNRTSPISAEELELLWVDYPKFGEYDQHIRLDRIPNGALDRILEYTDKEFPAFRQYLQRDIERYQEPKK